MIGYRAWSLMPNNRLGSISVHYAWDPGINEADHVFHYLDPVNHRAPVTECGCGIWMMSGFGELCRYLDKSKGWLRDPTCFRTGPKRPPILIRGVVQVWGRLIEHDHGYRCQFARIIALYNAPPDVSMLYDVPNFRRRLDLVDFAVEFASDAVEGTAE